MRTGASAVVLLVRRRRRARASRPPPRSREIARSRLRARTSSWTAGSSWRPASSRGKWRTLTSGGSLWVGPSRAARSSVTVPSASRRSFAASVPPKTAPGLTPGSAGLSRPKVRVIQIEPSFFGKPWIQPRASAKSRSTQMYGQVVTSSPSSSALTTRKNSLYWQRDGSSSSPPSVGARLPLDEQRGGAARSRDAARARAGAPRRPRRDRPSTRSRACRRRSATAAAGRATRAPRASAVTSSPVPAHQRSGRQGSPGGSPSVSRLSAPTRPRAESKRKYERGGSGPQVLDEKRSSGQSRGTWPSWSRSMSQ